MINIFANQVAVKFTGTIKRKRKVPSKTSWLGKVIPARTIEEEVYCTTTDPQEVPDNENAERTFQYRARLIRAVNVFAGSKSTFTIYMEDTFADVLSAGFVAIIFDKNVGEQPMVECFIKKNCKRDGSGWYIPELLDKLVFRDKIQMRQYIIATTSQPDPKVVRPVHRTSPVSSDDRNCTWPLVAGVILGTMMD